MFKFDFGQVALTNDPFKNFEAWLKDASAADLIEPTAMTLATANRFGHPSARIVLFKGFSSSPDGRVGFSIYTNYESKKSHELTENSAAALVFYWAKLGRQIRVEGKVEAVSASESDAYFASRPRGSQIGAWASLQSQKIKSREELLSKVAAIETRFADQAVPRPENWGGFRLIPEQFEFWQAGEFRLHDRFLFEADTAAANSNQWLISRLSP